MSSSIEDLCIEKGLKLTSQRRVILQVIEESDDHPDVDLLYKRASELDQSVSIATVYRTVRVLEEAGILTSHQFGDGRARFEALSEDHHDHLIDVETGEVIEFHNEEIEALQEKIAEALGYELVDHRLELYGRVIKKN